MDYTKLLARGSYFVEIKNISVVEKRIKAEREGERDSSLFQTEKQRLDSCVLLRKDRNRYKRKCCCVSFDRARADKLLRVLN